MPEPFLVDRRTLMWSAAAVAALPASSPIAAQSRACFSDAHIHLFNSSDLPVAGFAKYVLGPSWIGKFGAAEAVVDMFAELGKRLGVSADAEYERLSGARLKSAFAAGPGDISEERFGQIAANLIESRQSAAGSSPALAESYRKLEAELLGDANYPGDVVNKSFSNRPQTGRLATAISIAAKKAQQGTLGAWEGGALWQYRMGSDLKSLPGLIGLGGSAARTVGWIYLMSRSRLSHLDTFLDAFAGDGRVGCTLVNHLVDYDYWIDDEPRSDQLQQIRVMQRLRAIAATRGVELRTFAGFCPLRLAIERLRGGSTLFDRLLEHAATGAVAGFKLYPPMGFLPLGNAELSDAAFEPGQPYRRSPIARWRSAGGRGPLGAALDGALKEFYAAVGKGSIPIMAHGRHSNGSGPDYARRAAPTGWEAVVARYPIRLLLGHLIDGGDAFIDSTNGHDGSWDLAATRRLLTGAYPSGAQVYGDTGYIDDLIGNSRGAEFFVRLKAFFGAAATSRIVYGSDWIMLAREKNDRKYLRTITKAMEDARYSPVEVEAVLNGNLQRFLGAPRR